MWEPFTERAKLAIVAAQNVAAKHGCMFIGSEALLFGLVEQEQSELIAILEHLGVSRTDIKEAADKAVSAAGGTGRDELTFTPRSKRAIELAFETARLMNQNYIGTAHVFIGILRAGHSAAVKVLKELGITADQFDDDFFAKFAHPPDPPPPPPTNEERIIALLEDCIERLAALAHLSLHFQRGFTTHYTDPKQLETQVLAAVRQALRDTLGPGGGQESCLVRIER